MSACLPVVHTSLVGLVQQLTNFHMAVHMQSHDDSVIILQHYSFIVIVLLILCGCFSVPTQLTVFRFF